MFGEQDRFVQHLASIFLGWVGAAESRDPHDCLLYVSLDDVVRFLVREPGISPNGYDNPDQHPSSPIKLTLQWGDDKLVSLLFASRGVESGSYAELDCTLLHEQLTTVARGMTRHGRQEWFTATASCDDE